MPTELIGFDGIIKHDFVLVNLYESAPATYFKVVDEDFIGSPWVYLCLGHMFVDGAKARLSVSYAEEENGE